MDLIKYLIVCTFALSNVVFGLMPENKPEQKNTLTVPVKRVSYGNRHFAFELYDAFTQNEGGNFAISPFSVSSCMGMISMLAEGETLDTIQQVMHFPNPLMLDFGFREINESLRSRLSIGSEPVHLTPTNTLWTQKGVVISPAILTKMVHFWDGIYETDFKNASEVSRKEINAYVEEKTVGKIADFIPKELIDEYTRLVAVNTLYFSAPWKKPFPEHATQDAPFYGLKNECSIPFMQKYDHLNHGEFELFSMVEIPFTDSLSTKSAISLYLILPHEEIDLTEVECSLGATSFQKASKQLENRYVNLRFPRFKLETQGSLKAALKELALYLPLEFPYANGEGGTLALTDVIQTVQVEFNEWGSTCAAATGGIIGLTSLPSTKESTEFNCNRPFIFVIADKTTRSVLFMGKFVQPN